MEDLCVLLPAYMGWFSQRELAFGTRYGLCLRRHRFSLLAVRAWKGTLAATGKCLGFIASTTTNRRIYRDSDAINHQKICIQFHCRCTLTLLLLACLRCHCFRHRSVCQSRKTSVAVFFFLTLSLCPLPIPLPRRHCISMFFILKKSKKRLLFEAFGVGVGNVQRSARL